MLKKNRDSKVMKAAASPKTRNLRLSQSKEDIAIPTGTRALSTKHENENKGPTIPRNVNFYRHLITDNHCNENEIEWVLKLRSPTAGLDNKNKMEATAAQPFGFDGKTIEAQKTGRLVSDLQKNELHQVHHLFFHRTGPTASQGSVQFETGLRSYGASSDKLKNLEKTWRSSSKKDRKEFPKMYPSYEETSKIKHWSTKNLQIQTHTAFEGYLTFPKYGELYDRQIKNVSEVRHLLRGPNQFMATADWQLSMRNYAKPNATQKGDGEDKQPSLGELKKVNRKPGRI